MLSLKFEKLITTLKNLGCYKEGDFILKSGKKSNYYIDLRCLVSHPTILKEICELLAEMINNEERNNREHLNLSTTKICGLPYAGLPYVFGVSMLSNIPAIMLRKEQKKHGTAKMIEGNYKKGDKLIIIDDILTSGTSILESLQYLNDFSIRDIYILVDRCEGGREKIEKMGYKIHSLFTINDFMEA